MTIKINAQGTERKRLVQTIAAWLGEDAHYCGAPTFAYEIARFTVARDGSLFCSDLVDSNVVERLLQHIYDEGFDIDQSHTEDEPEEEINGVCISMPRSLFTDSNLENLKAIVAAKGNLIKKPISSAPITVPFVPMGGACGSSIFTSSTRVPFGKAARRACKASFDIIRILLPPWAYHP